MNISAIQMLNSTYSASRVLARISCCRNGNLSICRLSSRTSQGNGLRNFTPPSLPNNVSMKPRGRSARRMSLGSVRVVSTINTTSRSINCSIRACKSVNWRSKAGSAAASANTIKGRAIHRKSSNETSDASKTVVGSAFQRSTGGASLTAPSAARTEQAAKTAARKANIWVGRLNFIASLSASNIGLSGGIRSALASANAVLSAKMFKSECFS
jgi:hypothetical protein